MSAKSRIVRGALTALTALGFFIIHDTSRHEGSNKNKAGHHVAYRDLIGVWTLGYGDTQNVMPGQMLTEAEAVERLIKRVVRDFEPKVMECGDGAAMPDGVFASHISLAYNIGTGAYCSSTTARRARAKDYKGSCVALTWFNKAGGRVVKGLVSRREKERAICADGIPAGYKPPAWLADYAKGGPTPVAANDHAVKPNPNFRRRVQHPPDNSGGEIIKENPPPTPPKRVVPAQKCFLFYCWKAAA